MTIPHLPQTRLLTLWLSSKTTWQVNGRLGGRRFRKRSFCSDLHLVFDDGPHTCVYPFTGLQIKSIGPRTLRRCVRVSPCASLTFPDRGVRHVCAPCPTVPTKANSRRGLSGPAHDHFVCVGCRRARVAGTGEIELWGEFINTGTVARPFAHRGPHQNRGVRPRGKLGVIDAIQQAAHRWALGRRPHRRRSTRRH